MATDLLGIEDEKPKGIDNRIKIENVGPKTTSGADILAQQQKNLEKMQKGMDFSTQFALNQERESAAAERASQMGRQKQELAQSGLSQGTQDFYKRTLDQTLSNIDQQRRAQTAQQIGQRADMATGQLIGLGQAKQQQEEQALDIFLQTADLTNPDSFNSAKEQYKNIFGVDADFSTLQSAQFDQKKKKAFSDLTTHMTTNMGNYFNPETNSYDINKVKSDPQVMNYVNDLWEATNKGMPGPTDEFIQATLNTQLTTEQDIANQQFKSNQQALFNSEYYKNLTPDQQAQIGSALSELEAIGLSEGLTEYVNFLIGTGEHNIDALGNKYKGEDGKVTVTSKDGTVTKYKYKSGKWIDSAGSEVTDENLLDKLNEDFKPEVKDITINSTDAEVIDFMKEGGNSEDVVEYVTNAIDSGVGVSDIIAKQIVENPEYLESVMGSVKSITGASQHGFADNGEDGSRPGQRTRFTNPPAVGTLLRIGDNLVRVTSGPYDLNGRVGGKKHYGQKIDFEIISGPGKKSNLKGHFSVMN